MHASPSTGSYWDLDTADFTPTDHASLPRYDVAIVGAGYSGLATALFLARRGKSVVVLEERGVGFGCSSRNGGMVGPSFHKLGMNGLTAAYGADTARELMGAGMAALDFFEGFVAREGIDCDFRLTGRFRGARTPADLSSLWAECARLNAQVGLPYEKVGAADLAGQIGSRAYCGGVIYPRDGGLHPKKLVNALAERAEAAGAHIRTRTPVRGIRPDGNGHLLETPDDAVRAAEVVIATNGYSDRRLPSMNDRVVPIWVTVATTRALPPERIRAMSPRLRMHGETGRIFTWSRPTPDGTRFMFGGRLSNPRHAPDRQRADIAARISRIFPDLGPGDFEHLAHGRIAYTKDHAPHLNRIGGIWHLGGYCGSGVTRAIYFADKLARKITGAEGGDLAFDRLEFPRVPFRPLAPHGARLLTRYYEHLDARDLRRG